MDNATNAGKDVMQKTSISPRAIGALERLLRKALGWTPTDQSTPRKARTVQAESATTTDNLHLDE